MTFICDLTLDRIMFEPHYVKLFFCERHPESSCLIFDILHIPNYQDIFQHIVV